MRIICLSISHKAADLAMREAFNLGHHERSLILESLLAKEGVTEAFALSTCNRTELYVVVDGKKTVDLCTELGEYKSIDPELLASHSRVLTDADVIRHAFSLVCGLDSMVLGETEILGQVKRAYADAVACDSVGKVLNSLFQRAFAFAKHIRTGTDIGKFRVSVASVAVDEILRLRPDLKGGEIVVWGTGAVGRAAVSSFAKADVKGGTVISRDLHRARNISESWNGDARVREELEDALAGATVF
ncbi:MAG: hypothetical protein JXR97_08100, partial [Planctomycetes bacterium]|nr:hypothetical protein [Planctomycetota bacterium]